MPLLYVFTGAELAEGLRANGDDAGARAVLATSRRVAEVTGFDRIARALTAPERAVPSQGDSAGISLPLAPSAQPAVRSTDPARVRK
jgi:hypothetical protein